MQLLPVASPRLFPDFVACYSARLVEGDRSVHFAAGRYCAAQALRQLGGPGGLADVGRGATGEPIWPSGFTGSITHKDEYFSAAVTRMSDARSIGIDVERILDSDQSARIGRMVLLPQEISVGESLTEARRVILFFSIKEAVYKCLYPLVLKRFYYDALAVTEVDVEGGMFSAELVTSLSSEFQSGIVLSGRFKLDERRVYSGMCLPSTGSRPRLS